MDKKREILLKLLEKTEKKFKEYEKYSKRSFLNHRGNFLNRIKKLLKYRERYLRYVISELIKKPQLVKGKVFWGENFFGHLPEIRDIFLFGILGGQEIKLTHFLIKNLKCNSIFFDIGANYGFYSLLAKQLVTKGEVYSFEPTPSTFELLQKNLLNKDKVFLNQIALFSSERTVNFYENLAGKTGLNTFNVFNIKSAAAPSSFKKIRVRTTTLDRYCLTHSKPTFLKIDVEGAEGEVIAGGIKVFRGENPIIAMEVFRMNNASHLKAIDILYKLGYKSYKINNEGELEFIEKIDPKRDILISHDFDNFIFKK